MKLKNLLFAPFAFIAITGIAQATVQTGTTLDIRYQSLAHGLTTKLDLPLGGNASYVLGNYDFAARDTQTSTAVGSFIAYCVDPFQWASGSFHTYEAKAFDASFAQYSSVQKLFGHAYADSLTTATKAAGFQLALWEMFNDDGNLDNGLVRTTANTDSAVKNEAQSLLNSLPSWSGIGTAYQLTFYENATYQNYLAATGIDPGSVPAIPEADSYALLLAGLGLIGFVARRRQRD